MRKAGAEECDDANGFARRGVNKEGRIGFTKHDDAGAGVQK